VEEKLKFLVGETGSIDAHHLLIYLSAVSDEISEIWDECKKLRSELEWLRQKKSAEE
jgi:hypothetical protein